MTKRHWNNPISGSETSADLIEDCKNTELALAQQSPLDGYRILVAEDESVNQMVVKNILQKHGAVTTLVGDGVEAMDELNQAHYDLLLTDIGMPRMNGEELFVRAKAAFPELTVIALTGYADNNSQQRLLALGFDGVLTKPLQLDIFVQALTECLSSGA